MVELEESVTGDGQGTEQEAPAQADTEEAPPAEPEEEKEGEEEPEKPEPEPEPKAKKYLDKYETVEELEKGTKELERQFHANREAIANLNRQIAFLQQQQVRPPEAMPAMTAEEARAKVLERLESDPVGTIADIMELKRTEAEKRQTDGQMQMLHGVKASLDAYAATPGFEELRPFVDEILRTREFWQSPNVDAAYWIAKSRLLESNLTKAVKKVPAKAKTPVAESGGRQETKPADATDARLLKYLGDSGLEGDALKKRLETLKLVRKGMTQGQHGRKFVQP